MASVTELVENIRSAVYGKDVRESIASGIEQCFENNGNAPIMEEAKQATASAAKSAEAAAKSAEAAAKIVDVGVDSTLSVSGAAADAAITGELVRSIKQDIVTLSDTKEDGIVETEDGSEIALKDSAEKLLRGMRIFGKTTQATVTGAQLFDLSTAVFYKRSGLTSFSVDDGVLTISKSSTSIQERVTAYFKGESNKTYTISAKTSGDSNSVGCPVSLIAVDADKQTPASIVGSETVTLDENNPWIQIIFSIGTKDTGTFTFDKIMLNEGQTALLWEPYTNGLSSPSPELPQEMVSVGDKGNIAIDITDENTGHQSATFACPNGLPGIPVKSGGNYTDAYGQKWSCDEIDLERGKYVQRIKKVDSYNGETITTQYMSTTGELSTGATVYYVSSQKIETDLTPDEIAAYRALHTNYPTTTITNDESAHMAVSYVADTKAYVYSAINSDLGELAILSSNFIDKDKLLNNKFFNQNNESISTTEAIKVEKGEVLTFISKNDGKNASGSFCIYSTKDFSSPITGKEYMGYGYSTRTYIVNESGYLRFAFYTDYLQDCSITIKGRKHLKEYTDASIEKIQEKINAFYAHNYYNGKTLTVVGDSITKGYNTAKTYHAYLKELLGFSIVNDFGISGSTVSTGGANPMCDRVANITSADIITVFGGTNDFALGNGVPVGELFTVTDGEIVPNKDKATFYGAYNCMLETLLSNFHESRIICFTPIHREIFESQPSDRQANKKGLYLSDYVEAIKNSCSFYGVQCCDLYSCFELNPNIASIKETYFHDDDGLHPNADGHERLANTMIDLVFCNRG